MENFSCRHCGRPIAVPASKCPWCNETIMVICASCKAYTDDQKAHCEQCGAPLQADTRERLVLQARNPELARLVQDQEQSKLVASAVVLMHINDFFYKSAGHQTVLAKLFASAAEPRVIVAGVIFAAYAYLAQKEYCAVRVKGGEGGEALTSLARLRVWDGQQSIEGALAEQAGRTLTTREATEKMLRDLMSFRMMPVSVQEPSPLRMRLRLRSTSTVSSVKMRDAPERSALAAVDRMVRVTALPDHDPVDACRTTYRLLAAFVDQDQERARLLSSELVFILRDFESYT